MGVCGLLVMRPRDVQTLLCMYSIMYQIEHVTRSK